MKIQKKEESVFSTSALDLFCSAMGVFMLLCFVLMPYYRNETPAEEKPPTEEKPVNQDVSVITPSVTVAISWKIAPTVKVKEGIDSGAFMNGTYPKFADRCCDFDLYVQEILPDSNKAFLHDFQHIGAYAETAARLVADSRQGGSEAWVQPAVHPGESCDVFAVAFKKNGLPTFEKSMDFYEIVLHVLVLSGHGKTDEWELRLNNTELDKLVLTEGERGDIGDDNTKIGYASKKLSGQKRIPLIRIKVARDSSISAQPMPNSKLQQISQ